MPRKKTEKSEIQDTETKKPEPITEAILPAFNRVPNAIGKPTKYSPEIAQQICEQLSEGIPLRQICRQEGFPAWRTIYDWMWRDDALGDKGVGLSTAIAYARDLGYDAIAEDCIIIADTPQLGQTQVMDDKGSRVTIEDMLGHRKLQIETRLKLLAKFNPKKYGDRVQMVGSSDEPLNVNLDSKQLFDALLTQIELKRGS